VKGDAHPTILIVGTGSMASLFAARLAEAHIPAIMLGSWQAGLEAIREHGVRLIYPDSSERTFPVKITDDPKSCRGVHYALVLVKSWGTKKAAAQLSQCLALDGLALTLQNGLGNMQVLSEKLGMNRVAQGITTYGANLIEPGRVKWAGEGSITLTNQPLTESIGTLLETAGFRVDYTEDASGLVWSKMMVNAAINPLTAILEVPNGALLELPYMSKLMSQIIQETLAVAQAEGITIPYEEPLSIVEDVARRTGANNSSMLQDITRGTPTEIDAINGAIVNLGDKHNLPTPVNRTLWQLIRAKAKINRSEKS